MALALASQSKLLQRPKRKDCESTASLCYTSSLWPVETPCLNKTKPRAGEMDQLAKCWPCNPKDPSLIP